MTARQHASTLRAVFLPKSATADTRRLLLGRGLRGFADGFVSVMLAGYLTDIGYSPLQVSMIVTGTLLGSAALTLGMGLLGYRYRRRAVLLGACGLMFATGVGFAGVTAFWPLLVIAVAGTLNPSAGDVSLFLPTEQAVLVETVGNQDRTAVFARYNLAGQFAAALGSLASGVPVALARHNGWNITAAERSGFTLYAVIAVLVALLYRSLSPSVEPAHATGRAAPLARSRGIVLRLSALFSLDSLGGGFVIQSLLVLWLFLRFDLSKETAGAVFFVASLLSAASQLAASRLARRIGLINTMVFTHIPSNLILIAVAFAPSAPLAVALLLARSACSAMDVPARQSYVMAVVPPEERAAAASVTNVPRSLASAATPLLAGLLLEHTTFGWPLIVAVATKLVYDLLLLAQFRAVRPPEEGGTVVGTR